MPKFTELLLEVLSIQRKYNNIHSRNVEYFIASMLMCSFILCVEWQEDYQFSNIHNNSS